jgi:hypothetical protein
MQPADPVETAELSKIAHEVAERSSRILGEFVQKQTQSLSAAMRDEMGIAKAFMDLYARLAADPALLTSFSMNLWLDQMRLWQTSWMKLLGVPAQPVAEPAKGDKRFKDDEWSKNFLFDYVKQSYLLASRHIQHAVGQVEGLSPESEKKVAFFTTNCGMQEPLQTAVLAQPNAYYPQPCCPSPYHAFPAVLGLELALGGDDAAALKAIATELQKHDAVGRFSTWPAPVAMSIIRIGYDYAKGYIEGTIEGRNNAEALKALFVERLGGATIENYTNAEGTTFDNYYTVLLAPVDFNDYL